MSPRTTSPTVLAQLYAGTTIATVCLISRGKYTKHDEEKQGEFKQEFARPIRGHVAARSLASLRKSAVFFPREESHEQNRDKEKPSHRRDAASAELPITSCLVQRVPAVSAPLRFTAADPAQRKNAPPLAAPSAQADEWRQLGSSLPGVVATPPRTRRARPSDFGLAPNRADTGELKRWVVVAPPRKLRLQFACGLRNFN